MPEEPPPQLKHVSRRRPSEKSGAHRLSRPIQEPHVIARPGLKEPGRRENPGRAGTRGVARVTGTNFNPIMLIVKLRNIFERREKWKQKKSKGGEDWMSAPPRGKVKWLKVN